MASKRPHPSAAPSKPAGNSLPAIKASQRPPVIPLLCLAMALAIELLLYYGDAPEMHLRQRIECLNFLAAPDQLFLLWCGEKLAYFSLFDRWPLVVLTITILTAAWLAGRLLLI